MTNRPTEQSFKNTNFQAQRELIQGQLSFGKLVFLGFVTVVLSLFGPLSLLAPVPLTMGFLLYGAQKAWLMSSFFVTALWVITFTVPAVPQMAITAIIFSVALLYAYLVYRFVKNGLHPIKGLMQTGLCLLALWGILATSFFVLSGGDVHGVLTQALSDKIEMFKTDAAYAPQFERLVNSTEAEAKILVDTLSKPEEIVSTFLRWLPAGVFVGTFFTIWVCLIMVLRNSIIWRPLWEYRFGLRDLTAFKVPDAFVYPVILGLVLILTSDYTGFIFGEVIGGNLLAALAVFYFFQGFGILMDSFTHFGIMGLVRSLLIMLILFFAWRVVVFLGLFDTWINFRKFLKKAE